MPTFEGSTFSSFYKRIFQVSQTSNTGVDATTRQIETGDGTNTSLSLSDDVLQVKPNSDNTTGTMLVKNSGNNNILAVDTTNSKVLVNSGQVSATTQYAYFSIDYSSVGNLGTGWAADTHYGVPFNGGHGTSVPIPMGSSTSSSFNDTNPATTLTVATTAMNVLQGYWYVPDNITIEAVHWFHAADAATGDSTAGHLMGYSLDKDNGSTSGDLTGGTVLADGATISNAGYEQIYYQNMTIQSANVDAGSVILFCFASDTVNSDYTVQAIVKYFIR